MNEHGTCSPRIEKLSPKRGDLLVISASFPLKAEQREKLTEILKEKADRLDCELLVLEAGVTAQLQPSVSDLLAEQKKQTALLEQIASQNLALIEALADDQAVDPDAQHLTYMDGTPCR
ncbi:hypothetical protein [Pseudomonas fluorescens]|uniref:hypothetical protein n=1 Tax=Pseudomonas fluorescens TaxID=294 RepID=UPI000642636E|nr:hypothetical protein [Pseudomonas fluorescens]